MLRYGRPSLWAKRKSSRTIVAERSACQTSIIPSWQCAFGSGLRAKRDYAMLAMLLGCGLRRSELVGLDADDMQVRQGHWAIVDLIGKGGHIRTVPIPNWVKAALANWTAAAGIIEGRIFRAVFRGKVWGDGISQNVVWYVVKRCCERAGLQHIEPHDLRRTCAKLCHTNGGEIEQIQFLLGHASVQTTERYLGCKAESGAPGERPVPTRRHRRCYAGEFLVRNLRPNDGNGTHAAR